MLNQLEENALNQKTIECTEWEGCFFSDVCERNTSNCALRLKIQHKPLSPACQKAVDDVDKMYNAANEADKEFYNTGEAINHGTTGSGMSLCVKRELIEKLVDNDDEFIIIDPELEYENNSGADILNCATDSTDRREILRRPTMNIFAERLKTLRKEKGDTQSDVGKVINVTKVGILDMEKGRAKTTIDKAVLLADYFNVSLDYLVGRTDKR